MSPTVKIRTWFNLFTSIRYQTRKMNIFTQKFNPLTGASEWILKEEHYDYFQEIARSSFADMLHDTERNQKYFKALKLAIETMHSRGKKANVLDIGTGTGLLSMMAVQSGADSVVACEAFRPMAECARKVLKDNHFELDVKVIGKRSTELTVGDNGDLKQRANILVTEVFDTELIGEGALSTFKHAHEELLEKDCIVVPHSGKIYAQLVESPLCHSWNTLKPIANSEGEILLRTPNEITSCPGTTTVHDLQLSQLPKHSFTPLTDPIVIFQFDWSGQTPLNFDEKTITQLTTKRNPQQVFMWWDLNMDPAGKILLSCAPHWAHPDSPNPIPWRDHWMQAIYYLPEERELSQSLISYHDEYSLWFSLREERERPMCECMFHIGNSRTRIGQINQGVRSKKLLDVLEEVVKPNWICLSINDGSFISITIARLSTKLYVFERNHINRRLIQSYVDYNSLTDKVVIIDDLSKIQDKIDFIFSEPHFLSALVPWDNFQFKLHLDKLELSPETLILPGRGVIKGVAVRFQDLHKIRAPVVDCEGFSLAKFDKLMNVASSLSDDVVEPQPLWEYPATAVSEIQELYSLDFAGNVVGEQEAEILVTGDGGCNGVALWVDWDFNGRIITTGVKGVMVNEVIEEWDMFTRQGVYFVRNEGVKKLRSIVKFDKIAEQFYVGFKEINK